jgi:hypothetical protein
MGDDNSRVARQAFTASHPARAQVLPEGSGHKVMADKPDLVGDEILSMLKRVGGALWRNARRRGIPRSSLACVGCRLDGVVRKAQHRFGDGENGA